MKDKVKKALLESGAVAVGFAAAGKIDDDSAALFEEWVAKGMNAEMNYLERHIPLRQHTDNVLKDAATVISLAFSYVPEKWRDSALPSLSAYAYGEDYHVVLKRKLFPIVENLKQSLGGKWRICIDSAPMAERYWAAKSGVGFIGRNCCLITPQAGSLCFLVDILTTLPIEPDEENKDNCKDCGLCIQICPGKALNGDKTMDASRCINYLTIEKKSPLSEEESRFLENFPSIKGCDRCLRVCPHNKGLLPTNVVEFKPKDKTILSNL